MDIRPQGNIYILELIFGLPLSPSKYDEDEKKLTGGRAKLANIYSHEFAVETADKNTQQKYEQTWTNNASPREALKDHEKQEGGEYICITFRLDLTRFGDFHKFAIFCATADSLRLSKYVSIHPLNMYLVSSCCNHNHPFRIQALFPKITINS